MARSDRDYFERRAEAELELARNALQHEAVQTHYDLACAYLDRIYPADGAEAGAEG